MASGLSARSGFLLQVALGPVQGFIATARRTRDLWFGSYVLSEIAKAVARHLHANGAVLVFPFTEQPERDLADWSPFLVANIVTAEKDLANIDAARELLEAAEDAARRRWAALCQEALGEIDKAGSNRRVTYAAFIDPRIWNAQLEDVVEVFLAAVAMSEGYARASSELRALMANRKNTRDFAPFGDQSARQKSSLDGAQSTVMAEGADRWVRRRLGVEDAEQLDTASMVKRVIGRERAFVPVARVAAAPWIERAHREAPGRLEALAKAMQRLEPFDFATRLDKRYDEYGWIKPFPYDSELLYAARVDAMLAAREHAQDASGTRPDFEEEEALGVALEGLRKTLHALKSRAGSGLGEPPAYYALLLADGDRMGGLINKAAERGAGAHRAVTKALSAFAQRVPEVMRDQRGACIYSGGDDVLGFVVLPHALVCSRALAKEFREALAPVARDLGVPDAEAPTLSVGLGIAHHLQPLGDVRALAAEAEMLAKGSALPTDQQRNALALRVQPRSGAPLSLRIRWNEATRLDLVQQWLGQFEAGSLAAGLPHDLCEEWRLLADAFEGDAKLEARLPDLWSGQVRRLLSRKREGGGGAALAPDIADRLWRDLCVKPDKTSPDGRWLAGQVELLRAAQWLSGHADMVRE